MDEETWELLHEFRHLRGKADPDCVLCADVEYVIAFEPDGTLEEE